MIFSAHESMPDNRAGHSDGWRKEAPRGLGAGQGSDPLLVVAGAGTGKTSTLALPLFAHGVCAGFPSPADDYLAGTLDLNEYLVAHKEATFFLRVKGHSMIGAGIHDGDLLVVDRALAPAHRSVVIAVVDGEFTVKRLCKRGGRISLLPENPDFAPIEFNEGQELQIWGVVTSVVHRMPP